MLPRSSGQRLFWASVVVVFAAFFSYALRDRYVEDLDRWVNAIADRWVNAS